MKEKPSKKNIEKKAPKKPTPKRKHKPPVCLEMDFEEALSRIIRVKPEEIKD